LVNFFHNIWCSDRSTSRRFAYSYTTSMYLESVQPLFHNAMRKHDIPFLLLDIK
jgi:hypothetical protein